MKKKVVAGVTLMLLLILLLISILGMAFDVTPVVTEGPPIKIGVMRNLLIQGQGIEEGTRLAVEEINAAGGVLGRNLTLYFGDEGTDPATGMAEMERLITVEEVDFIVGGFRTEIVFPMREIAMDHKKIFIITGAATNELFNCFGSLTVKVPCYQCVRCDYDRYKYMFRVAPPNSTMLFMRTLIPFLKYHLVPNVLGGTPDSKVKVAAVVEDLAWADVIPYVWQNLFPIVFGTPEGLSMEPVYLARPSHTETDFSGILTAIKDKGARLILHVFSGEAGPSFIQQWGEMHIPAIPVGVNFLSQRSEMWPDTGGKCEYEAFISTPPRVNVTEKTIPFWDSYIAKWGHDPVYTTFGAYDAVYAVKDGVEAAGSVDSDAVVAALEGIERDTVLGRSAFTQYHDLLIKEQYPMTKHPEWVTPFIVQWRSPGQREVIFPFNRTYTTEIELPPWMIPGYPIAAFNYSPEFPFVGQTVTFDASASYDSDGTIVSYDWDFGDGTNGTDVIVDHAYASGGVYTVTSQITDDDGITCTASKAITIEEPPPFSIYTDKYTYSTGNTMLLGLSVYNSYHWPITVCIAVWLEKPDSSIIPIFHDHAVTLPADFTYSNPNFETFVLPNMQPGVYTWHVAFLYPTTHTMITEDTSEWEFV